MNTIEQDPMISMITGVHLPLENVAYTIEQYLLTNGNRLDVETRFLLAGVRDSVGRAAGSARQIFHDKANALS